LLSIDVSPAAEVLLLLSTDFLVVDQYVLFFLLMVLL
jgi:hypothetical protein